jgi:hypothetical protein
MRQHVRVHETLAYNAQKIGTRRALRIQVMFVAEFRAFMSRHACRKHFKICA